MALRPDESWRPIPPWEREFRQQYRRGRIRDAVTLSSVVLSCAAILAALAWLPR